MTQMNQYNAAVIDAAKRMHNWLTNDTDDRTEDEFLEGIEKFGTDLSMVYDVSPNRAHADVLTVYETLPGNLIDEMDDGTYPRMTSRNLNS